LIFVQLSKAGGRLIIASDGVWDALSCDKAVDCCRGMSAELAARQVVKVGIGSLNFPSSNLNASLCH
jgi:serine/threonine protein phosphatase PrpC